MKEPTVVLNWAGALTPAQDELTDSEIQTRFGSLMRSALSAFQQDPTYIVEMAETAASLKMRRRTR